MFGSSAERVWTKHLIFAAVMDTAALQMKIDALERELAAVTDFALRIALEREIEYEENKHMRRMQALNVRRKSLEEIKDQLKCQAANSSPPQQAIVSFVGGSPTPPPYPPQQAIVPTAPPPPYPPQQAIVPYQHVPGALQSYSDAQPQLPTLDDMN